MAPPSTGRATTMRLPRYAAVTVLVIGKGLAMRLFGALVILLLIVGGAAWALGLIDIDQTRKGALPEIRAEGGTLPKFDVKAAQVDVGTTNTTVQTPTIEVKKPK
jgi:hypothetical protein